MAPSRRRCCRHGMETSAAYRSGYRSAATYLIAAASAISLLCLSAHASSWPAGVDQGAPLEGGVRAIPREVHRQAADHDLDPRTDPRTDPSDPQEEDLEEDEATSGRGGGTRALMGAPDGSGSGSIRPRIYVYNVSEQFRNQSEAWTWIHTSLYGLEIVRKTNRPHPFMNAGCHAGTC